MEEAAFHRLLRNYLYPLKIGKTAHDLLQEFIDIDVNGDDLVRILGNNPVYLHMMDEFVTIKSGKPKPVLKEGEKPELMPTRRLLALLGMVGSRNFILALRLIRSTTGNFPYSKEGKLEVRPEEHLRLSLEMEELCQKHQIEYSDSAYTAAFLYDWLFALLKRRKVPTKVMDFANFTYKNSIRTGLAALGISRLQSGFGYHKFAFAAGICTGIGKIVMAAEFDKKGESFLDFLAERQKSPVNLPVAAMVSELETFETRHTEISALCLSFSTILHPLEKSVLHHLEPFYLNGTSPNEQKLGQILYSAAVLSKTWRPLFDDRDPLKLEWQHPMRKKLKGDDAQLNEIMKWATKII